MFRDAKGFRHGILLATAGIDIPHYTNRPAVYNSFPGITKVMISPFWIISLSSLNQMRNEDYMTKAFSIFPLFASI